MRDLGQPVAPRTQCRRELSAIRDAPSGRHRGDSAVDRRIGERRLHGACGAVPRRGVECAEQRAVHGEQICGLAEVWIVRGSESHELWNRDARERCHQAVEVREGRIAVPRLRSPHRRRAVQAPAGLRRIEFGLADVHIEQPLSKVCVSVHARRVGAADLLDEFTRRRRVCDLRLGLEIAELVREGGTEGAERTVSRQVFHVRWRVTHAGRASERRHDERGARMQRAHQILHRSDHHAESQLVGQRRAHRRIDETECVRVGTRPAQVEHAAAQAGVRAQRSQPAERHGSAKHVRAHGVGPQGPIARPEQPAVEPTERTGDPVLGARRRGDGVLRPRRGGRETRGDDYKGRTRRAAHRPSPFKLATANSRDPPLRLPTSPPPTTAAATPSTTAETGCARRAGVARPRLVVHRARSAPAAPPASGAMAAASRLRLRLRPTATNFRRRCP